MFDRDLELELSRVAVRWRRSGLLIAWSICWLALAAWLGVLFVVARELGANFRALALISVGTVLAIAAALHWFLRNRTRDLTAVARLVERRYPDLDHRLLAAIEQASGWSPSQLGYLQQVVVHQAKEHSQTHEWRETISTNRLAGMLALHTGSLALLALVLSVAWQFAPAPLPGRGLFGFGSAAADYGLVVEPGNTTAERGTDVLVMARFNGRIPSDVHVVVQLAAGSQNSKDIPLTRSLKDPVFGGRITSVAGDLVYYVEYDGQRSPEYRITAFDYPEVVRIDAQITLPQYTGLPEQRIEDTRDVRAVQGSAVTLIGQLNKAVERAWLTSETGEAIELIVAPERPTEYRVTIELLETRRYTLHLMDSDGRANKLPPEVQLTALPNRPAELALQFPGRDVRASALEEVTLQARAWDDFGISSYGLTYLRAGQPAQSITLGESAPAKEGRDAQYTLHLEDLDAEPDQLISYFFWADDMGPDSQLRRTRSDMYFIEVRPFEEIYRQGEQPTDSEMRQSQGEGDARSEQLAENQKQIIQATWNLIRATAAKPADIAKDAGVIGESQQSVLDRVREMAEQARGGGSPESFAEIERPMKEAIQHLEAAAQQGDRSPLDAALAAEQSAYQALLKLNAREHQVVRSRSMAQSSSSGGNRADRQLSELELDANENRYESRRAPPTAEQQAAREDNQVLNRLRELARRQQDLNQRIQELQSALQAAQDESQRNEMRRQLDRLRDEQQELLRDLDELRTRMENPENQRRMADSSRQLDETRQNMLQASESLRQEQLAPALSSGSRAERDLEQVRDEFRRRTANQFSDEMRSMRDQARQLSRTEQELGNQLEQLNNAPRQSLRDTDRSDIVEQLAEQRTRLQDLTEDMKTVSEAAETTEPLLSRQLYDTLRDTAQRNPDRAMELTAELLRRGFLNEAGRAEQKVREDVEAVRQGVERAANSILGDPADAARRALEEVEDLTRQLEQEIARADPQGEPASQTENQAANSSDTPAESSGEQVASQPGNSNAADRPQEPSQSTRQPPTLREGQQSGARTKSDSQGTRSVPTDSENTSGRQAGSPSSNRQNASSFGGDREIDVADWTGPGGPITGEQFREWTDRLRDVEEMLESPDLRADVATINDRAREMRRDLKRHSKEPNWSMVRELVAEPLVELQEKLREELARLESSDKLVPIDRDPVPHRYSDLVREYYERLGSGK